MQQICVPISGPAETGEGCEKQGTKQGLASYHLPEPEIKEDVMVQAIAPPHAERCSLQQSTRRIDRELPPRKYTHFSTRVRGSRSLTPATSREDTLSRVEGERELKTRLDLFDTFSFPLTVTGAASRGPSPLYESVVFSWGR